MEISCCRRVGVLLKESRIDSKEDLGGGEVWINEGGECREKETGSLVGGFDHGLVFQGEDEMEEVPSIPSSRTRYGKKRTRSMYRANPGKVKRRRLRLDHVKENKEDGDP